jgi:hypothetical protein
MAGAGTGKLAQDDGENSVAVRRFSIKEEIYHKGTKTLKKKKACVKLIRATGEFLRALRVLGVFVVNVVLTCPDQDMGDLMG